MDALQIVPVLPGEHRGGHRSSAELIAARTVAGVGPHGGARAVLESGYLPFRRIGRTVWVAVVVEPTAALAARLRAELHADRIEFERVDQAELAALTALVFRDSLVHEIGESLAERQPDRSARAGLTGWQRVVPVVLVLGLVAGLVAAPRLTVVALLTASGVAFSATVLFRVVSAAVWPVKQLLRRVRRGSRLPPDTVEDADLPVYTILVPVFHEANIVSTLLANLDGLDYPRDKLQVLVLIEEDDLETMAAAWAAQPPEHIQIVVVPRGAPQTKPRACNYGLIFARGEFVVIYDAEDRPESDQLRRVVADFARARREQDEAVRAGRTPPQPLACVQCSLSYFNASYNVLTRLFAIEYSFLFDAMLPGLDGTGVPIPLGGTSNHFDTAMLRALGGWDPYNVTEDADLGMRAAGLGYRVGVNTSSTWEEACSQIGPFIRQRTRWIKGYLMTAAVNFRHPVRFTRATGIRGMLCLVALVLGTPAAFLVYPLMLSFGLLTLAGEKWGFLHLPSWATTAGTQIGLIGTSLTIVASALAAWPRYGWRTACFAVFSPAYWVLHAVAAWRAAWQTMVAPHVWEKTPHGLSDDDEDDIAVAA